jgi:hypothetical protein
VDKDVYVFNELSGTVEQVGGGIQEEMDLTASSSPTTPYRSMKCLTRIFTVLK